MSKEAVPTLAATAQIFKPNPTYANSQSTTWLLGGLKQPMSKNTTNTSLSRTVHSCRVQNVKGQLRPRTFGTYTRMRRPISPRRGPAAVALAAALTCSHIFRHEKIPATSSNHHEAPALSSTIQPGCSGRWRSPSTGLPAAHLHSAQVQRQSAPSSH